MKFLSCDPGESTGYAVWEGVKPIHVGTASLFDFVHGVAAGLGVEDAVEGGDPALQERFEGVELLVIEDWALYPWKLKELGWDKCRTARGIGALEFIAHAAGIPYLLQPAAIKDASEAAGAADLFLTPLDENRHANDALRHGVFYMLTHPERFKK